MSEEPEPACQPRAVRQRWTGGSAGGHGERWAGRPRQARFPAAAPQICTWGLQTSAKQGGQEREITLFGLAAHLPRGWGVIPVHRRRS